MSNQNTSQAESLLVQHPMVRSAELSWSDDKLGSRQLVARVELEPGKADPANSPIKFSLFFFGAEAETEKSGDYKFFIDSALFADANGFEAVWTPERHFHEVGGLYPNPSTLSAALAVITKKIKLRAGSVALPLHHTLRIAEEWAVVDCLSNGRAGVSIATGWHPRDFVLAPERFSIRRQDRIEGIDTLRRLWAGESINLPDGLGSESEIKIFPRPVQSSLPLSVTATGHADTFTYAGRIGAGVLTHLWDQNIEKLKSNIDAYHGALKAAGHPSTAAHVTVMVHTFISYDFERTIAKCKPYFIDYMKRHLDLLKPALPEGEKIEDLSEREIDLIAEFAFKRYSTTAALIGTPQSCSKIVEQLRQAGVNEIACLIDWLPHEDARGGLEPLKMLMEITRSRSDSINEIWEYCRERLAATELPNLIVESLA